MRCTDDFDDVARQVARLVREANEEGTFGGPEERERLQKVRRGFLYEGIMMAVSYLSSANRQLRQIRYLLWAITIILIISTFKRFL